MKALQIQAGNPISIKLFDVVSLSIKSYQSSFINDVKHWFWKKTTMSAAKLFNFYRLHDNECFLENSSKRKQGSRISRKTETQEARGLGRYMEERWIGFASWEEARKLVNILRFCCSHNIAQNVKNFLSMVYIFIKLQLLKLNGYFWESFIDIYVVLPLRWGNKIWRLWGTSTIGMRSIAGYLRYTKIAFNQSLFMVFLLVIQNGMMNYTGIYGLHVFFIKEKF